MVAGTGTQTQQIATPGITGPVQENPQITPEPVGFCGQTQMRPVMMSVPLPGLLFVNMYTVSAYMPIKLRISIKRYLA